MRFLWPAQRYDGLTSEALALATGLTVAASIAIALPLSRRRSQKVGAPNVASAQPTEFVAFIQPLIHVPAGSSRTPVGRASVSHTRPRDNGSPDADTGSVAPVRVDPRPVVDTAAAATTNAVTPSSRAIGPVAGPAGFSKVMNLSDAARDSLNKAQAEWLRKRLLNFELTPEQKDSAGRQQAQQALAARDDHRPLAIPLGSIPLRMPFGGRVKSREQQRGDSVVNADYLQRLARLAERARAKRDSTMRATLAAKRDTDDRRDSLTRFGRPRP
jgi:hypothetical protein